MDIKTGLEIILVTKLVWLVGGYLNSYKTGLASFQLF